MLNFIYYPVSAILWFWHKVFGFALGADNGFAWALSVIFLVFTLRALLFKPFVSQVRSMRKMQEFQPQIKKLQEKYKNDKQKLAEEMQKLQKEHGVNPLGGCLPVLVQLPVFIGLFHVLRGFQPNYPYNYVFSRADVVSFNNADILGVKLSEAISGGTQELGHFSLNFSSFNAHVIPVALPLMIIASVATHFTARISVQHQTAASAANPQAAIMQKLTMWLFPIGVLVFGAFFPIAILLYWLSNNSWTLTQQWYVYGKIAREEQERRAQAAEQRDLLAPKPGQKPKRPEELESSAEPEDAPADEPVDAPSGAANGAVGTTPKPGARPASGKGSGRAAPGKVSSPAGKNGSGKNGSPGKNNGGRSGQQLASSGRPGGGKKSKKRR
ncbi:membrane protein insertase YidC [Actinomycetospora endophytica]|uniref:Membrane protein insertase YidC n=1 Tax=Actinomycetospora endophytica TaxID=2291215 RepID=A0ABS8P4F7_9PSEU|nr:membrane protein insertase YidC [Actinomycetospora endophytica]MCD2193128.1 membrane protein insertase YidC [Actinomycetospora endophytica]